MKLFSKTIFKNTCSVSLSAGWSRSGWSPRTSRNTWSQRASRKHRQRWATGPPRRTGETLAFFLTWSLVPVFTELTHSTAVASHIWVTLCWQPLLRRPGAASHWAEPCAQCWVQTHCISFYTCVLGRCSKIKVTWFKICTNCVGQVAVEYNSTSAICYAFWVAMWFLWCKWCDTPNQWSAISYRIVRTLI